MKFIHGRNDNKNWQHAGFCSETFAKSRNRDDDKTFKNIQACVSMGTYIA